MCVCVCAAALLSEVVPHDDSMEFDIEVGQAHGNEAHAQVEWGPEQHSPQAIAEGLFCSARSC